MTVVLSNALLLGNTMVFEIQGVQKQIDGSYVNDASLAVTIEDADGNALGGESWPVTMSYVPASNGTYRANLAGTIVATVNDSLVAHATGTADGLALDVRMPIVAQERTTT